MRSKLLHQTDGRRVIAAALETGDEAMACIENLAREEGLDGAAITGIGAFSNVVLAYFDWERKDYIEQSFNEQLEVASLIGDIALDQQGEPSVHIHLALGRRDFGALAGHLRKGRVRPTLELVVTESPPHLCRRKDAQTGLALLDL